MTTFWTRNNSTTLSIPKGYVLGISWHTGCGPLYQLFVDVDAKGFNSSVVVVVGLVLGGQGKGQILRKQLDHIITRIAGFLFVGYQEVK